MVTIVLIHPGCTSFDIEQRIQGNLSIPLNRMGKEQTVALAQTLKERRPECIYAPAVEPDWECAQVLGQELNVPVVEIAGFQNVNMGLWQGMEVEELHKCQPTVYKQGKDAPWTVCPPSGESLSEAQKRVLGAIKKLSKKWSENSCVAIIASEPVAGLIRYIFQKNQGDNPDFWNLSASQGTDEFIEISKEDISKL